MVSTDRWPSHRDTSVIGTPFDKLVESNVPARLSGSVQRTNGCGISPRRCAFGYAGCIMLVPDATGLAASSSGLVQTDDGIAGCRGFRVS